MVVRVRPGREGDGLVEALLALGDPAVVVVDLKQPRPGLPALLQAAARTGGRVKVAVECRSGGWLDSARRAFDEADAGPLDGAELLEVIPIGSAEDLQRWGEEGSLASARVLGVKPPGRSSSRVPLGASMLVVQAHAVVDVLDGRQARAACHGDGQGPVLAEVGIPPCARTSRLVGPAADGCR